MVIYYIILDIHISFPHINQRNHKSIIYPYSRPLFVFYWTHDKLRLMPTISENISYVIFLNPFSLLTGRHEFLTKDPEKGLLRSMNLLNIQRCMYMCTHIFFWENHLYLLSASQKIW